MTPDQKDLAKWNRYMEGFLADQRQRLLTREDALRGIEEKRQLIEEYEDFGREPDPAFSEELMERWADL